MPYLETINGPIYTQAVGTGEALVVINGGPGLELNYLLEPLKPLGGFRRLHFFDQFGCGKDQNPPDSATFQKTVDHAAAFIDALELESVGLLGHSFGAILALAVAERLSSVREIIFLNPIPSSWEGTKSMSLHRLPRATQEDLDQITRLQNQHTAEAHLELINLLARLDVYRYEPAKMKFSFEAFNNDLCTQVWNSMDGYDYRRSLEKLTCRSFVLYGDKDFIYPTEIEDYRKKCTQSVGMEDIGHHPFIESPQLFIEHLRAFLIS